MKGIEEKLKIMIEKIRGFKDKIKKNEILQAKVWENKKTYLPIILNKIDDEVKNFPDFNMKEAFYDPEKMLYMQLKGLVSFISKYSDAVPSVRFNFGTGFIPSVFGLESEIFEDKMPWLKKHLSKEEIKGFQYEDFEEIEELGLMKKVKDYFTVYKNYLSEEIKIYLPDTQGPFNIAHLIRGNEIFIDIYDDIEFFKFLLELTTFVYIKITEKLKKLIKENLKMSYHSGYYFIAKGGIRICEDSTTLLSPKHIEVVLTYTQKCLKYFGGGWIHYCGETNHFFDAVIEIPELTGINLGIVHPEKLDEKKLFRKINNKNKVYMGSIPRKKDEDWKDYLKRIFELSEGKNLIFIPSLRGDEKIEEVYEFWRKLNDQNF
ncbi:MAG: hypothetical protein NC922_02250 [Candidatus Omnitrophica bacterium]|nr:hypothetical protein [Candidatus Omnitrophota bacterium]